MMYVIRIGCNNLYLKKDTAYLFNKLSQAHIFDTHMQARHANIEHGVFGTIKKITPKELFKAKLQGI